MRIWKCALARAAGRASSERGTSEADQEAGDGGCGRGFHGRPLVQGHIEDPGAPLSRAVLRDVRPRPFLGMPEMQLASGLHGVLWVPKTYATR